MVGPAHVRGVAEYNTRNYVYIFRQNAAEVNFENTINYN
jgi:hypothetical protein